MSNSELSNSELKKYGLIAVGGAVAGTVLAPRQADASITNVSETITELGGIAGAITTVVLGAMGVRMAIKLVNRVAVKG